MARTDLGSSGLTSPTRRKILSHLKRCRRATVRELADRLGVTAMAIRQHLTVLERDGYVERALDRRGRRKPSFVYYPTPRSEEAFPKAYDMLASHLLDWADRWLEQSDRRKLMVDVGARLAERYVERVAGESLPARVEEVGRILDESGYLPEWEREGDTFRISWHACPYFEVAQGHRELCCADTAFLSRLLGVEVRLVECMLDGGGRCASIVADTGSFDIRSLASRAASSEEHDLSDRRSV